MEKQNTRKRTSSIAKNHEIKFQPPKSIKQDVKLDKLPKSKLVEKCSNLQSELEELKVLNARNEKEMESLKEKIRDLQTRNHQNTDMSSKNTQTYPNNDVDYNCGVCIFQTSEEENLWAHMDSEHDVRRQTTECVKCSFCLQVFSEKTEMMHHIKIMHEEMAIPCKYFMQGTCMFSDDICWYSHKVIQENNETQIIEFKCKYCNTRFPSKKDLMNHRKNEHQTKVVPCKYNTINECKYGELCWYFHETNTIYINNNNNEKTLEILKNLENRIIIIENDLVQ